MPGFRLLGPDAHFRQGVATNTNRLHKFAEPASPNRIQPRFVPEKRTRRPFSPKETPQQTHSARQPNSIDLDQPCLAYQSALMAVN